ncbi:MAG: IPTL-CTERM sorting domain-containing protein [Candidatus Thiodiazotropha sp.]
MRHNFTLTGNGGETGSGYIIWDDAVVLDGNELTIPDIIETTITITGGATPGGTQIFVLGDWLNSSLFDTPNFATDINMIANNGAQTLTAAFNYNANASWGSLITFAPGATVPAAAPVAPQPIPSLGIPGLILISLLMALAGVWQIRRTRTQRNF